MKTRIFILFFVSIASVFGQSGFSPEAYEQFLEKNKDLNPVSFLNESEPLVPYCNLITNPPDLNKFLYLDSLEIKLGLTDGEKELLEKNQFMVTERLSFTNFGDAFHEVYRNDLPVFITTDAILHAFHKSYDQILISIEKNVMLTNLTSAIQAMYDNFENLQLLNKSNTNASISLEDVDLYITIALSLIKDEIQPGHLVSATEVKDIWDNIMAEKASTAKLFCDRNRNIDFSQFKPRGHYVYEDEGKNLEPYFRCMMWLGRIEIFLTPPPKNPWEPEWTEPEMQRMIQGAIMINDLEKIAGADKYLDINDEIITYLVGKSDNVTPVQLRKIINDFTGTSSIDIYKEGVYSSFQTYLKSSEEYQQKILSEIIMVDPYSSTPDTISVVYKLMGQRFILDSYILGSLVYDKIIFNDQKVPRMMPDPLDAMYVLGNDNGALLMEDEIEKYKYASNLKSLRYLVESYDDNFWNDNLYNIWLSAIQELNPGKVTSGIPFFMITNAWQHEKLNTQLASWSQLRHDNLLYAKQSYTAAIGCSYPYAYVEPYPEMYGRLSDFAEGASTFFNSMNDNKNYYYSDVVSYFTRLDTICDTKESLIR